MTKKQKEKPIVPNRYVDFFGDPVEGAAWSLKKHFTKGCVVATLVGAGAFMAADLPKKGIVFDAGFSVGAALWLRVMQARRDERRFNNKVIDTQPIPSQRTSPEDEMEMRITQLMNSVVCSVHTGLLGAFNVQNAMSGEGPTFWLAGGIGDDVKRVLTARKVLKGQWVIISRDEMKREAPQEEKNLQPAMAAQARPIPIRLENT